MKRYACQKCHQTETVLFVKEDEIWCASCLKVAFDNEEHPEERLITVCSECKCASCWFGIVMCNKAQSASTIDLPISALRKLNRESESYWEVDEATGKSRFI